MDEQENLNLLTDANGIPAQDGQIPIQSIASEAADGIGIENIDIAFESGNFSQIQALPQQITQKITAVSKTLVPLIEVALIELTGSSVNYKRQSCQLIPSIDANSNFQLSFDIIYFVNLYIATDVDLAELQKDSTYIYNRIAPTNMYFTKCEIDTSNGQIHIMGSVNKPEI